MKGTDLNEIHQEITHFGFETIPVNEKDKRVAGVFNSVSMKYDLMNDVISLGSHRILKRIMIESLGIRPRHTVLDLAGGTGDLSKLISKKLGPTGTVFLCDINESMLQVGQNRLIDLGIARNVQYTHASAEDLPFSEHYFDRVVIGYGLRNFTNQRLALQEIYRVLKPGGRLSVLEFSTPKDPVLSKAAKLYSSAWPAIGRVLTGSGQPYKYLVESIQMHPDQETLKSMMKQAGFGSVKYTNFFSGICALHTGVKA